MKKAANHAVCSTNAVVQKAIESKSARNGRVEDKVRVTMDCFDFDGVRKVTKVMTLAGLKQLFQQVQAHTRFEDFVDRLNRVGTTDTIADKEVTIDVTWASRA